MDPERKGRNSLEGDGLSVSLHPEEWSRIARLPGDTWTLRRPDARFLDVHALDSGQLAAISAWAVENGLCERTVVFRARYEDEEGEARFFELSSREEALTELGLVMEGEDYVNQVTEEVVAPDEVAEMITEIDSLRATPALLERMRQGVPVLGEFAMDLAIIAFGSDVLDVEGCWWDDFLDPEALSAPRGVIFPARLAGWTVARRDDLYDEDIPGFPSP